jgi:hypothetical protein
MITYKIMYPAPQKEICKRFCEFPPKLHKFVHIFKVVMSVDKHQGNVQSLDRFFWSNFGTFDF